MADPATIEDGIEAGQSSSGAGRASPGRQGSKPKTNKIIIGRPFSAFGREDNQVDFIKVDHGPKLLSNWKVHNASIVEVFGKGLDRYNQVTLWIGSSRELIRGADVRAKAGDLGLKFIARFAQDLYSEGASIRVV